MLARTKSSGRMLADPELLSLLDLHFCEARLQADETERGKERTRRRTSIEVIHGTCEILYNISVCRLIRAVFPE